MSMAIFCGRHPRRRTRKPNWAAETLGIAQPRRCNQKQVDPTGRLALGPRLPMLQIPKRKINGGNWRWNWGKERGGEGYIRDTVTEPGVEAVGDREVEVGRKPGGLDEDGFRLVGNLKLQAWVSGCRLHWFGLGLSASTWYDACRGRLHCQGFPPSQYTKSPSLRFSFLFTFRSLFSNIDYALPLSSHFKLNILSPKFKLKK